MAAVLLTGGTGALGRAVEPALLERGHTVRLLSRREPPAGRGPGTWVRGDLQTGDGLDTAAHGVDTIIHCATSNGRGDIRSTENLIAAARKAGNPHLIYVSIVGVDSIPMSYYRAKFEAEQRVETSALPWTILRAAQFHKLVFALFAAQRRLPLVFAPDLLFQPIDVRDVAAHLAELAAAGPAGRAPDIGGPEILSAEEIARLTLESLGVRRRVVPLRFPGKMFAAYKAGNNLVPGNPVGKRTFAEFAAEQVAAGP
ncbi:SDR family oxidoreductase [Arthrobacter crystallopoietes]|uniref:Uncharacterized conserved protein YbjT, contains NAD(P)-binding and DUF2867 domains n=1 Tax=Crystallibacter crystallopoietes TaxID=37928 RepID=A0A1H1AXM8_9MICC|nr:NAD(P)H-binding protein [Arthrobacter crystallopoietes]AUI51362.1 NmrA family transcriptional regulator [Arthrobacter crystallopoietes]SDQ44419.1 Uncharacterized conserved protein YbjT, contains NAD(P)-binding and DUF2867 domains [Arthrobacter crystallopoietes]